MTVTGATANLPQAAHDTVVLTWTAPALGGTVTGQRLWCQTDEGAWGVLGDDLAAGVVTPVSLPLPGVPRRLSVNVVNARVHLLWQPPAEGDSITGYAYRVQTLGAHDAGPLTNPVSLTLP